MASTAFFYDVPLHRDADGRFYGVNFAYPFWGRYLGSFDRVIAVTRSRPMTELSDSDRSALRLASGDRVEFAPVPGDFRRPTAWPVLWRHVASVLQGVDAAIVRLPSIVGTIAAFVARRIGKPYAAEVVGCPWDALRLHGSMRAKLMAPAMTLATRNVIRNAPYAIYVSKEFLQRRYPCYGVASYCSNVRIPTPDVSVLAARGRRIRAMDVSGRITVGLVGSPDVAYKGHDTALRALAAISRDYDVHLKILGPGKGTKVDALSRRLGIRDRVELTGLLSSGTRVFEWLDSLDVFLMPSLLEGTPRSLIEAMSRAVPCVASAVGGIPELLPPESLHAAGDWCRLQSMLRTMLCDQTLMLRQSEANFAASAEYAETILDARRSSFWSAYAAHVHAVGATGL